METYPHIVQLRDCPTIFAVKEVIATEKLHGSNFRLGFPLGMKSIDEVEYGSRETEYKAGESFPLGGILQKIKKETELLTRMMVAFSSYGEVTVFGEAYGPGIKAKGVRYANGQEPLFRAFDIMIGKNFVTYDLFVDLCDRIGLPRVHEVWRGEPTPANLDALLEKPSTEGLLNGFGEDNIAEGVVIRSNPLLRDVFGDWLICKHKCAKFTEIATAPKEKAPRGVTSADIFAEVYVTSGRVINAVGRLHDRGVALTDSMRDMPTLLTEICEDLAKDYPEELAQLGVKDIKGNVSKILSPIYKALLEEKA